MIDIAILRAMAAAGASVDMIIAAVELAQAPEIARRKRDADRKREERARHSPRTSEDVRGCHRTSQDSVSHIDTSSSEDTETKKVRKKSIAAPLPDDWRPSEQGRAYARARQWPEDRIDTEGERFRNNSHAKGLKHANVEAAWRNWVTSPYQKTAPPASGRPRPGSREDRQEKTADALAQLDDFIAARADERRSGSGPGEANAGLLSFPKLARS